jgi:hypothetical protein
MTSAISDGYRELSRFFALITAPLSRTSESWSRVTVLSLLMLSTGIGLTSLDFVYFLHIPEVKITQKTLLW